MRDPYLYEDVDVLKNRANIKDSELLRKAEADVTNLAMSAIYTREYDRFTTETLCDIHKAIFDRYLIGRGNSERYKWSSMKKSSAAIRLDMHFQRISKKN